MMEAPGPSSVATAASAFTFARPAKSASAPRVAGANQVTTLPSVSSVRRSQDSFQAAESTIVATLRGAGFSTGVM
jgi:hypothetical protein